MVKMYNKMYPSRGRIYLDGGQNSKFDKQLILDNESPDCQNVIFSQGSVETREGSSLLNTTAVGSFVCDGLYTRSDSDGSQTMVAWFGGSLYDLQGTSFATIASAQSIYTAGTRVSAAEYQDYMFFGNGDGIPYKYNGTDFTRHGIYAPTSAPTLATAATGTVLTGDYRYLVTYVNSGLVESDIGTATSTFTAAGENIALSDIPVAPQSFGVNSRKIYRTEAGGSVYKLVTTIGDNTTTNYEDGVSDGDLGSDAPTDQGVPPNYSVVLFHQARLFVIDPDNNWVAYSDVGNPFVFKALSFRRIGDSTGDIPQSLAVYDNSIVVGCKRSHWLIYLPSADDSTWVNIRIKTPYGSKSPFAPFLYRDRLMIAAMEGDQFVGFAAIRGDTVDPDATLLTVSAAGSDLKSNRIEDEMFTVNNSFVSNISSVVWKNKAYITVSYDSSTTNNRIYYFDFSIENLNRKQKFAWAPWTGLNAAQFTIYNNNLYYGSSDAVGFVYRLQDGTYNDNGQAIDSYYWTKEFSGEPAEENWVKDFRWLQILYGLEGDYNINISTRVESDQGSGNTNQINTDPGGSLWGTMIFGVDNWDAGRSAEETKYSIGGFYGKRIQFKFDNQNAANQKFKILGLNIFYNLKGLRC